MTSHKISVTVDSARGLAAADVAGLSDPYAEVYIGDHRGKRRGASYKTATIKRTLNPRWNETFTFTANERELSSSSLVIKVMDWDRFTRNDKLGYFVTPLSKVVASGYMDQWVPLIKSLRSNMPASGNVHLIVSVDGKGPTTKPEAGMPAGAAAPYQPQYAPQPPYTGGGQQQPPYMGGGAPMQQQQQPMMQPGGAQGNKYPGLGTTGSYVAPPPAQGYPAPAGMPLPPPPPPPPPQQQPMMQQGPYGGQPPMAAGYAPPGPGQPYPPGMGQQPPAAGYPQQAAPPLAPQGLQSGLSAPAAYIPSFRPQ